MAESALGCDDAAWERGLAWAFEQAVGLVWYYRTSNPPFSALGRRSLERILRAEGRRGPPRAAEGRRGPPRAAEGR